MRKTLAIASTSISILLFIWGTLSLAAENSADKKDPLLIYRSAGVSQEQEAKIRQFAQEYDKAGRVRVERLRNLSRQMKDLSYDAELDEAKILSMQSEINDLQNAINTERTKLMIKIRSLLGPEQKAKLVDLMRESDPQAPPKKASDTPPASPSSPAGSNPGSSPGSSAGANSSPPGSAAFQAAPTSNSSGAANTTAPNPNQSSPTTPSPIPNP